MKKAKPLVGPTLCENIAWGQVNSIFELGMHILPK